MHQSEPEIPLTSSIALPPNPWDFWRLGSSLVEVAKVHGTRVALPMHFHDEDQWIYVSAGQRRFLLEGELIEVMAGEVFEIPAGIPHQPLDEPNGVISIEGYAQTGTQLDTLLLKELGAAWRQQVMRTSPCLFSAGAGYPSFQNYDMEGYRVSQAAAAAGMTREGYSRAFKRKFGMSPKAYDMMRRLNDAKQLLRMGRSLAHVAVETGFTDQSHLGRQFRRTFGIAPGAYRCG